jgi:hypothetical protein
MKFIVSSLSPAMVNLNDFAWVFHEVSEEEFQALTFDAYSCVGHQDIADALAVAYNKEPVHARPNDILLYANLERGVLKFYCIQVLQTWSILQREIEKGEINYGIK